MSDSGIDILMVTHNRPLYTSRALRQLLESCDESMRVWIWHNGIHRETLNVVKSFLDHPCVHQFHHSEQNVKLTEPTNWLWRNARGGLVGKVDDDCLVPKGSLQALQHAHAEVSKFGALSLWNYGREDVDTQLHQHKIKVFSKHKILKHPWIGGGTYVMKRECVRRQGGLKDGQGFPSYCISLAWQGWINGWLYPLIVADHMDDPRSGFSLLKSDQDIREYAPLTAERNGVGTIEEWVHLISDAARYVQTSRTEPCRLFWLRRWPHRIRHLIHGGRSEGTMNDS